MVLGLGTPVHVSPIPPTVSTTSLPGGVVLLPSAFSPNQDGINDQFQADSCTLIEFSIVILDEKGTPVFSSQLPDFSWNGNDQMGNAVSEGIYQYEVKGLTADQKTYSLTGSVTLVR